MRYLIRTTARRLSDRKKVACMQPISEEMLDGERTVAEILPYIVERTHEVLMRTAESPFEITNVKVAEQQEVTAVLTQEDFDDDPEWAEAGYKPGDTYTDYITLGVIELDKKVFAKPLDTVVQTL